MGGGRGTFCLFWCKILALGSTRKHPNHRLKVAMMNCQFCAGKWLVGLATLGPCHCLCSLDKPEWLILACSQVSQNRLRVCFIQFGEEARHQMPWEVGHPTSLAGEGDEQYLSIWCFNLWFISIYTPDWFQTFNFVQFYPQRTSI
jgi:hypothetical protein